MAKLTAVIHIAKTKLGMDEETYRAFLLTVTGKDSCAKMTTREQGRVLDALRQRGFTPHKDTYKGKPLVRDPQARKIRALWLAMADEGIVRNRSEKALEAYMRRITGRTLEDANVKQCTAVIETLKAWMDRCCEPQQRARCLSILSDEADAPAMLNGSPVSPMPTAVCQ